MSEYSAEYLRGYNDGCTDAKENLEREAASPRPELVPAHDRAAKEGEGPLLRAANWFEERGGKWDAEFIAIQLRALAATQPPQELEGLDHKELANFFWRHAPVLWKDRWTCRCGQWALSRELNSVEQADESRSQHVADAFLEWRAALTRGEVGKP